MENTPGFASTGRPQASSPHPQVDTARSTGGRADALARPPSLHSLGMPRPEDQADPAKALAQRAAGARSPAHALDFETGLSWGASLPAGRRHNLRAIEKLVEQALVRTREGGHPDHSLPRLLSGLVHGLKQLSDEPQIGWQVAGCLLDLSHPSHDPAYLLTPSQRQSCLHAIALASRTQFGSGREARRVDYCSRKASARVRGQDGEPDRWSEPDDQAFADLARQGPGRLVLRAGDRSWTLDQDLAAAWHNGLGGVDLLPLWPDEARPTLKDPVAPPQATVLLPPAAPSPPELAAQARALHDAWNAMDDLMTAPADEIAACLEKTRDALPADVEADRALEEGLAQVRLAGIGSTQDLRALADLIRHWRTAREELEELVRQGLPASADGLDAETARHLRSRLLDWRQTLRLTAGTACQLLQGPAATLQVAGVAMAAVAEQPSLSIWLGQWIESAYESHLPTQVKVASLAETIRRACLQQLPVGLGAPPVPGDEEDPEARFRAELAGLERQLLAILDREIHGMADRETIAAAGPGLAPTPDAAAGAAPAKALPLRGGASALATEPPPSPIPEAEITALDRHFQAWKAVRSARQQFDVGLALMFSEEGAAYAIRHHILPLPGRDRPGDPLEAASASITTFETLADLLDLVLQHRPPGPRAADAREALPAASVKAPFTPAAGPLPSSTGDRTALQSPGHASPAPASSPARGSSRASTASPSPRSQSPGSPLAHLPEEAPDA